MGYIAESIRRFYHPAAIDEMLSTFLPLMNGTSLSVSRNTHATLDGLICLIVTECISNPVLPLDVPPDVTSAVVSSNALPHLGVDELVYVRRTHDFVSLSIGGDACGPHCQ